MNSRSSSTSALQHRVNRRPSISSRISFAVNSVERADGQASATAANQIHEEIDEIKRYEDFTTIDWVQDAAKEQLRRKIRRKVYQGGYSQHSWRQKIAESYDAGQAWLVVSLIGTAIGLNAGVLNIVTEWLSDTKLGHCKTGFYLNQNFCCFGVESGKCLPNDEAICKLTNIQNARTGSRGQTCGL
jgi:chloride channel 3/4/5